VYPVYTQLAGGVSVTVPLVDGAFDLPEVATAVTPATKMVLLATPNNPTGRAVSTADLAWLLDHIADDVIVVIDEAYREFLDPTFGDPVRDLVPRFPNVVVTRTFSKAHGLAGIRIGYAVGHPEVITAIDKTLVPFAVNVLAQAAALAVIDADDEIAGRVADIVSERARVVAALETLGWRMPDQQANFVWLPMGPDTDRVHLALEKRGVVTRPFSGEGIRVTIGTPAQNDRFLADLAEVAPVPDSA
jgi:histidinol-phosphate aminotransferase